ncbi:MULTISPECIES: MBL fold metallo-hydrolase [unclassified Corynebacterium]|uniref:MBL fold metallo-hydrolase n=1 Tax=unclassified Corynebacterium TaxID=2624378 RepID=UPI001C465E95|nr:MULTISPECIES: MBL fold metallo-hydrolase [unclassified Corynebacterium]MBV7281890.1 MBL fold metallo-hydrolase [Corynebacterium sp. TAE3-ERU30]MBV7301528.1 MBL fold metallo-hydrolase [Corynebacterium sp. TAE3-ERU2]
MKLTIIGCTGSMGGPGGPASGYLLQGERGQSIIMDIGPGVLAQLMQMINPSEAHVVFSHLHADHCLDFPSLLVWRRFHPELAAQGRNLCFGPSDGELRLGRISADETDGVDDMSDTFAYAPWRLGEAEHLEGITITPFEAIHPIEAYSLRIEEEATGTVFAYSGDTSFTNSTLECARGADVFFCEATWGYTSEGKPEGLHISGREAGLFAREAGVGTLVLIHIPPWGDVEGAVRAAAEEFDGPIMVGAPGQVYTG